MKTFVGQKLKTKTNELVTIVRKDRENIYIEYKGKTYKRPLEIIGKKLFVVTNEELLAFFEDQKKDKKGPFRKGERTCQNCIEMRKGECFGRSDTCSFFRYAPSIANSEKANWPKYGDATSFRLKNKKRY